MKTTIQVEKQTLLTLKQFKIAKRESYEEIIKRLVKLHEEKLNEQKQNLYQ